MIAHGGQKNEAARAVAARFATVRFIVTQGNVAGANLGSYEVLREHSAWLAGALAGLVTRTGVVGHMSGIPVTPGLKGRAAFADGVRHTNPSARLLTNFSGSQDDNALSRRVAAAMGDAGADVLFTMLNAGRTGAIEVCRERGIPQIGNVRDWVADMPDVFIASAVADSGLAVLMAIEDLVGQRLGTGQIRTIGLNGPRPSGWPSAPRFPAACGRPSHGLWRTWLPDAPPHARNGRARSSQRQPNRSGDLALARPSCPVVTAVPRALATLCYQIRRPATTNSAGMPVLFPPDLECARDDGTRTAAAALARDP